MIGNSNSLEQIELFVKKLIEDNSEIFLVEVKSTPGNKITVLLDSDKGITIEHCTKINRALYKFIEESEFFPDGNFSLEVSSPGVDRPLQLLRQYKKNIGRSLEVTLLDGTHLEGKLTEVNDDHIILEQQIGKGKKMTMNTVTILVNQIKHAYVLITF